MSKLNRTFVKAAHFESASCQCAGDADATALVEELKIRGFKTATQGYADGEIPIVFVSKDEFALLTREGAKLEEPKTQLVGDYSQKVVAEAFQAEEPGRKKIPSVEW